MVKKTLLFSNTIGDVTQGDADIRFNSYMEKYLASNVASGSKLVFIDAPGLGGEDNYLSNILKCFARIGIIFAEVICLGHDSTEENVSKVGDKAVYFLMGGNPLAQMEIIKKLNLIEKIRDYEGLVIGFCAGAINLSKHSIITSDEDFDKPLSYEGIRRVPINIEPHYNDENDEKRNSEIENFVNKYEEIVYAIPDESMIVVEGNGIREFGKIYHFGIDKEIEKSCGCIILKDNKVLLIGTKDDNGKLYWSFPKGHQEVGESDTETALRETREEVGLDVKIIDTTPIKIAHLVHNGKVHKEVLLFVSEPLNDKIKRQEDEVEIVECVPIDEVSEYLDDYYSTVWDDFINRLNQKNN